MELHVPYTSGGPLPGMAKIGENIEMQVNLRRDKRRPSKKAYSVTWKDESGLTEASEAVGIDISDRGVGIRCPRELRAGITVYIQANDGHPQGYAVVRSCTRQGDYFRVGLELDKDARNSVSILSDDAGIDHYEFLQISPNAETETIQRIYRYLAARYHPDNPKTGDPEKFLRLNQAFDVLSDPERRRDYDLSLRGKQSGPMPGFDGVDFMDGVDGELNRRLALLALLYRRRRANVHNAKVTLVEVEKLMGFPREYLDFTTWYLRTKKYITREDNSDFELTAIGVDFVESNYSKLPVLYKLLNAGHPIATPSATGAAETWERAEEVRLLPANPETA